MRQRALGLGGARSAAVPPEQLGKRVVLTASRKCSADVAPLSLRNHARMCLVRATLTFFSQAMRAAGGASIAPQRANALVRYQLVNDVRRVCLRAW